jgi:hypothetical protein
MEKASCQYRCPMHRKTYTNILKQWGITQKKTNDRRLSSRCQTVAFRLTGAYKIGEGTKHHNFPTEVLSNHSSDFWKNTQNSQDSIHLKPYIVLLGSDADGPDIPYASGEKR